MSHPRNNVVYRCRICNQNIKNGDVIKSLPKNIILDEFIHEHHIFETKSKIETYKMIGNRYEQIKKKEVVTDGKHTEIKEGG